MSEQNVFFKNGKRIKITVIGCGRWGSCIAWYLDKIGHDVTLYGRASSAHMQRILHERANEYIHFSPGTAFSTDLAAAAEAELIVISIGSQALRGLCRELRRHGLQNKTFVLCMKGIENTTCKRLSEVLTEELDHPKTAVWLGPGHVEEFYKGIPNCMVIDSADPALKSALVDAFSGDIIRFYYGTDLVGNEIGAAAKNVIGIAAGMLDGLQMTSLKGALMSRGTREIARLIDACGGSELSAYGLCHLGDYQATVFSPYSHNRRFGEAYIRGESYDKLAEGYHTVPALVRMAAEKQVELPICHAVYDVLYEHTDARLALGRLFERSQKNEF